MVGGHLNDPEWRVATFRKRREDQLEALLSEWCAGQDVDELEVRLSQGGLAAARVMPLQELYTDIGSDLYQSGFIKTVDHEEAGQSLLPSEPWHFSGSGSVPLRPSPRVGEHSREVLIDELGLSEEEYSVLVEAKVTGTLGYY